MRPITAVLLIVMLAAGPAAANDSSAELATGGLVFVRNSDVEMRSEELTISAHEIRGRYVFVNRAGRDATTLVAFPMPDVTVEHSDVNISIPTEEPENLLGFPTTVGDHPVASRVEQKVFVGAVEHTALRRRYGVPLPPHLAATGDALDGLPRPAWDELMRLGLAEIEEYDVGKGMEQHLRARWTLKTTYFWRQTFPARGETVIEHRYRPSVGGSVQTSSGEPSAGSEPWYDEYRRKYRMNSVFLAAIERARRTARSSYGALFAEQRIAYILKTGANWAGPIRDFRLVVDKGDPAALVSFCGEGVRKIAATQFEMRKTDLLPAADFHVLILTPPPQ